jgi:hypothetical protein
MRDPLDMTFGVAAADDYTVAAGDGRPVRVHAEYSPDLPGGPALRVTASVPFGASFICATFGITHNGGLYWAVPDGGDIVSHTSLAGVVANATHAVAMRVAGWYPAVAA